MTRPHLPTLIFAAAGIVLIAAFFVAQAVHFMRTEHTIYCWDNLGLWLAGAEMLNRPHHTTFSVIAEFGRSMHRNYNYLCGLPSACVMAIWGTSRFCYIIANVLFLILPAVFVCLWLFFGLTATTWPRALSVLLAFLALVATPLLWLVTLSGLTDVGGLVMAAIATDLLSRTELNSKSEIRWLAIGAAMAMDALSRRWYLFFVIGLLVVLVVEMAIKLTTTTLQSRSVTLSSITRLAYGPFLCVCGLAAVYQLSFPFILEILRTNYSDMYAPYKADVSWFQEIGVNGALGIFHYGLAQFLLSLACFVAALFFEQTRRAAFYLFFPGWLAVLNFSRVQTLAAHHFPLIYIPMVALPLFLAKFLFASEIKHGKAWGWAVLGCATFISCLNYHSAFASEPPFGTSALQNLFSQERIRPIQRHDIAEIEAMMQLAQQKIDAQPDLPSANSVYLLSSSLLFNSSYLTTLAFQLQKPIAQDYVSETNDVDTFEGFPDNLITARVVLVADPVQTHLLRGQKVVTVPTREFLEGGSFAQAFTQDPHTFQLDGGIRVHVFERTRPSTPTEIAQLRQEVGVPSMGAPKKP
jgi:hypothetical protein